MPRVISPKQNVADAQRFQSYRPAATGPASSALQSGSSTLTNLLTRTRSSGTMQNGGGEEEEKNANSAQPRKKAKLDESATTTTVAAATAGSLQLNTDNNAMEEDDDFFSAMDPGATSTSLKGVSAHLAAQSFFRTLDESKENNNDAVMGADSAAAMDESNENAYMPLDFAQPPLDWNIHSKIRFTSRTPFSWIAAHSIEDESDGFQAFLSTTSMTRCNCLNPPPPAVASHLREFHHALQYAIFPAVPFTRNHPLTAPFLTATMKPDDQLTHADLLAIKFVRDIWVQWEDAFKRLYDRLRLPQTSPSYLDHFYTVHQSPHAFTVLFLAGDVGDDGTTTKPAAIVSRSTRTFRQAMSKAGIRYTMPNSSRPERGSEDTAGDLSAVTAAPALPPQTDQESDAILSARVLARREEKREKDEELTPASVLLIDGRQDLHTFYDFLMHQDRRELAIPTLLASSAFVNSSPQALNVVNVATVNRSTKPTSLPTAKPATHAASPSSSSAPHQTEYILDISGYILPSTVVRLLALMSRTQPQFHATFSSDLLGGQNMNCISSVIQMDELHNQDSLALCQQPALRTNTVVHLVGKESISSIGTLKRVKYENSQFRCQLM